MRAVGLALSCVLLSSAALSQNATAPPVGTPEYDAWKLRLASTELTTAERHVPASAPTDDASFTTEIVPFSATDGTWTPLPRNDDGSTGILPIGFDFEFYGDVYSSACVNNNGNISFVNCVSSFSSTGFPSGTFRMVAGFWADVDTRNAASGLAYYKQAVVNGANVFVAHYDAVGYFNNQADKLNSFQIVIADTAVLPGGNNVCFAYGNMDWTTGSASGGSGGFGGVPATVGTNKGDNTAFFQFGRYDKPGTEYDGPGGTTDGVDGLDNRRICVNTGAAAGNIPPVVSEAPDSDINLDMDEPFSFTVRFIAPESNQSITLSTTALPSGVMCELMNGAPGGTATATCTGGISAGGTYDIGITATDDGSPSLSTTQTVRLVVAGAPPPPADTTPPVCGPVLFDMSGPGAVFSTITDDESGIASVRFTILRNLTGTVSGAGPFAVGTVYTVPGTPASVVLRGTRINPAVRQAGLLAVITNGAGLTSTCDPVVADLTVSAAQTTLGAPSPNPVRGASARVPFALAEAASVRLSVYDALGREVARLADGAFEAGSYVATWDDGAVSGGTLAAGVYVVRFEAGPYVETRTLTVVR